MKYIIESVLNYVKKENTKYAILLNGKWGSGKTYFWENSLKDAIEQTVINGKNQKTIYVSLYGISSIDEINKRIVLNNLMEKNEKIQSVVDTKWGGRITELAKMGLGVVKSLDFPILKQVLESEVNYENLLDFTDTVLCFDDLERANIEIPDILGYINNFVEHDGAKVIIIGYENELSEKLISRNLELKMLVSSVLLEKEGSLNQKQANGEGEVNNIPTSEMLFTKMISLFDKTNEYKRIKEKLIGKTLTLTPNYSELISDIINQISFEPLKSFLNENLEMVIRVFKDSRTENIRILKQGLDDFELIYHKFQDRYSHLGNEVLSSVLIYTLAASFEIKSGTKGNEDLADVTNDVWLNLSFAKMFNKGEKSYLESFKEKYYSYLNRGNALFCFKFAELLVRKGILDLEVFDQEMKAIEAKTGESTPLYLRFIRDGYWKLSDEEFFDAEKQAYEKLVNGEVYFVLYFRAFTLYRHLIEKGLVQKEVKDIKEEFMKGIDLAAENAEYYTDMSTYFISSMIEPEDYDSIEFKEKVIAINQELGEKQKEQQIQELMTCMTTDFSKFVHDMREKYFYVPVFINYDVNNLLDGLLSLSNREVVTFTQIFEKRYTYKEDIETYKLYLEKDNLYLLKNKINEYINGKDMTLKLSLLKDLSQSIEKVILELAQLEPKEAEGSQEIKSAEVEIEG
ncbi:P-loop NTPase fold protein [Bacillus cereus]|uniref:P-loop NTPase fold protein n=1 Tax=Bacillus cereus TaxID=1396 RepID=UPI00032F1C8D|nr:P-loop NTPase fold protein [Bacillus cereus]EOP12912.1 hypothetical protein II1_03294 [Bacillus cereus MC118]